MKITDIGRLAIKILGLYFFLTQLYGFMFALPHILDYGYRSGGELLTVLYMLVLIGMSLVLVLCTDRVMKLIGLTGDESPGNNITVTGEGGPLLRAGIVLVGIWLLVSNLARGLMQLTGAIYDQVNPGARWHYSVTDTPGEKIITVTNIVLGIILTTNSLKLADLLTKPRSKRGEQQGG